MTRTPNSYTGEIKDYVDFTTINTSPQRRKELDVGDIFLNQAECRHCGWIIRSKNRHNMAYCKCEKSAIDGGSWYIKTVGDPILHTVHYTHLHE